MQYNMQMCKKEEKCLVNSGKCRNFAPGNSKKERLYGNYSYLI